MKKLKFNKWLWSIIILALVMAGCTNGEVNVLDATNGTQISQSTKDEADTEENGKNPDEGLEEETKQPNQSQLGENENPDPTEDSKDKAESSDKADKDKGKDKSQNKDENKDKDAKFSDMKVHFIDVGQGDSILIESKGNYLLIDAGENNQGSVVVNYLKSVGVTKLDYVIGTHPHSDHIGGLDIVLNNFTTEKIIMPNVAHNTATFEDVLNAVSKQGLKITKPVVGTTYQLGEAEFTIIAPNSAKYEDLNDYSVGVKLTHGDMSFVFTGDADRIAEGEMVSNGIDLSAQVLKMVHHGSRYSNTEAFLNAVAPSIVVASVGEGNSYGHPHQEVLDEMKERGITVYRTDLSGTIVATSDGKVVSFNVESSKDAYVNEASDSSSNSSTSSSSSSSSNSSVSTGNNSTSSDKNQETGDSSGKEEIVHITETGSKYHRAGCRFLSKSDIEISLENAVSRGLEPCGVCY